jgi:hypothetical protein
MGTRKDMPLVELDKMTDAPHRMIYDARQLAIKRGDDLADGLCSTSRRRNDVSSGTTSSTPVLI